MFPESFERPTGVYLVSLYFFVAGFLEAIQTFRDWGSVVIWNPFAEHSLWHLVAIVVVYMAVAYLIWHLTWFGRLAGLVYGYLTLLTYLGVSIVYLRDPSVNISLLFVLLGAYHVVSIIPMLAYLQPAARKNLFNVSLLDILLPHD